MDNYDFKSTSTTNNYRINFWRQFGFDFEEYRNGYRMSACLNFINTSTRKVCFEGITNVLLPAAFTFVEFENKENIIKIMQENNTKFIYDARMKKLLIN